MHEAALYTRALLSLPTFDRLLRVDELSKNTDLAKNVTQILQQMAHISIRSARGESLERWKEILTVSYEANAALNQNGQAKLILTNLLLHL
jgi:hypothetical protein